MRFAGFLLSTETGLAETTGDFSSRRVEVGDEEVKGLMLRIGMVQALKSAIRD